MSETTLSIRELLSPRTLLLRALIVGGVIAGASLAAGGGALPPMPHPHLHWPHVGLLAGQPAVIQIHVAAALVAIAVGALLLAGVKGNRRHRILGWGWCLAMGTVAVGSFFIHTLRPGGLSLIHLASGYVTVLLPVGVLAARRHRVVLHRKVMTGLFTGGLLITGLFTFAPGRLMYEIFFG